MTSVHTLLTLLLTLTSLCLFRVPVARAEPLVVVVGKDSPVNALSMGDLQRIFLSMPMQDPKGVPFVPFNYPARTPARERFDHVVLGMSPLEVGQHWIDQRIRGNPAPPRTMQAPTLLCRVVARLPGAIAYIPASLVGPQCKAVAIDGRKAKDPGYVLASDAPRRRVASNRLHGHQPNLRNLTSLRQRLGQLVEPSSRMSRASSRHNLSPTIAMEQHVQPALQSSPPTLQSRTRHCLSSFASQ
jgi:hypothetical protein